MWGADKTLQTIELGKWPEAIAKSDSSKISLEGCLNQLHDDDSGLVSTIRPQRLATALEDLYQSTSFEHDLQTLPL